LGRGRTGLAERVIWPERPAHLGGCRRRVGCRRDAAGTALVEFALILPFLAMLVFGTVDLARAYQLENRLKNAAREGGRLAQDAPQQVVPDAAARCGATPDNITYAATHEETGVSGNFAVTVRNQTANTPITGCTPGHSLAGGTRVLVQVSAPLHVLTPFVSNMVGSPITVSGTYEVVVQGS